MEVWKIIFLSKWVICRFHVNLPGGIWGRIEVDFLFWGGFMRRTAEGLAKTNPWGVLVGCSVSRDCFFPATWKTAIAVNFHQLETTVA